MLILYNPPSNAQRKPILPMSLLALGALLEGAHEYKIVDGNLEDDTVAAIDRAVRETGADILGVTVMPGPQLNDAVPLCRQIKALHPNLTIVWGGYFPTQHYEVCLKSGHVDYVVRGHGEVIFKSLLDALRRGDDPTRIVGLAYRHPQTGEVISNPMAPIPHPDQLPDFPYDRVDVPRYVRRTFMGARTLPHHSSYGCPFFCNFCAVVNMVNGRWLAQSAERTADVAHDLVKQWGVDSIEFDDNNFFTHEARTAEFAGRIRHLGIGWWGEARIDTLMKYSDRTWALMRDAGLRMVFLGAESGSDETLKRMNKGGQASTEKTLALAARMKQYGVVPEMSFVLGNPPDPESDVSQTMEFIRKVKRVNPDIEIILYMYTPVPLAGELYEEAKAEGFQFPETLEEWISPVWREFSQRRSTNVPWLEDPVRRKIRDFQWVINAYYPTATDINL
ncbi:MAG: B12-binding domain-containing radical SAM protein, partial [Anaerolineae bacterium]